MIDTALEYLDMGLSILPLRPGNKKPFGKWKRWQDQPMSKSQAKNWWGTISNPSPGIGIITGVRRLVVLDVEPEHVKRFTRAVRIPSRAPAVETARGGLHLYFSGEAACQKLLLDGKAVGDVRGRGGYVVAPPTVTTHGVYEWLGDLDPDDLPEVPTWAATKKPRPSLTFVRVRSKCPGAILDKIPTWVRKAIWDPHVDRARGFTASHLDFRICAEAIACGATFEEIEELYETTILRAQLEKPNHTGDYLERTFDAALYKIEEENEDASPVKCFDAIVARGDVMTQEQERVTLRFWCKATRRTYPWTLFSVLGDGRHSAEWLAACRALDIDPKRPLDARGKRVRAAMRDGRIRRIVGGE